MDTSTPQDVTLLLRAWSQGDEAALHRLAPLVYDELRRIASRFLRSERASATLQTTVLVHEAYIKLVEQDHPDSNGRAHFTAVAAKYMRQILVEHARRRNSAKVGPGNCRCLSTKPSRLPRNAPPNCSHSMRRWKSWRRYRPKSAGSWRCISSEA